MIGAARLAAALASLAVACSAARPPLPRAPTPDRVEDDRARAVELEKLVGEVLDLLAAADPRLAAREGLAPSEDALKRVEMDAIFAEDDQAVIRGASLDLFAFRARARALELAAAKVKAFGDGAPERGAAGAAVERPRLEYERLARLIDEERARVADEEKLGDSAADLVRAMVGTWTPPATPQDGEERDEWVTKHLRQIRDSLRGLPRTGPVDLDTALNPLERLLRPSEYPKSAAAIAELRVALDEDMRAIPALVPPGRLALEAKAFLGVSLDPTGLAARIEPTVARLRELAVAAIDAHPDSREAIEARARELLFVEARCPAGPGTRLGAIAPPPERALSCAVVSTVAEEPMPGAAIVALHDEVLLALSAVTSSPPPRTRLLCHPDDDAVDAFRRRGRERPVPFVGLILAAEWLFGPAADTDLRVKAWRALGDAPLDIVTRLAPTP